MPMCCVRIPYTILLVYNEVIHTLNLVLAIFVLNPALLIS